MKSPTESSPFILGSEESFRTLVESIKDYAIIMLDTSGHVASWNPGAERIKGWRPEEIIGKHFSCFYPPESVQRGLPEHELKVAAEEGRFEDEGWRVKKTAPVSGPMSSFPRCAIKKANCGGSPN